MNHVLLRLRVMCQGVRKAIRRSCVTYDLFHVPTLPHTLPHRAVSVPMQQNTTESIDRMGAWPGRQGHRLPQRVGYARNARGPRYYPQMHALPTSTTVQPTRHISDRSRRVMMEFSCIAPGTTLYVLCTAVAHNNCRNVNNPRRNRQATPMHPGPSTPTCQLRRWQEVRRRAPPHKASPSLVRPAACTTHHHQLKLSHPSRHTPHHH